MALSLPSTSIAGVPTLEDLTQSDVDKVVKDFVSNFQYSSVSAARGFEIAGFNIGVTGGVTDSPGVDGIVTSDVSRLPRASLLATIGIQGFNLELGYLPEVTLDEYAITNFSVGAKLHLNALLQKKWAVDVAFRFHVSRMNASYSQEISSIPVNVEITGSTVGFDAMLSKKFGVIEPYLLAALPGKVKSSPQDQFPFLI